MRRYTHTSWLHDRVGDVETIIMLNRYNDDMWWLFMGGRHRTTVKHVSESAETFIKSQM